MTRRLKDCRRSTAWRCVYACVCVSIVYVCGWVGVSMCAWLCVGVGVTSGLCWLSQLKDAVMKLEDDQSMEIEMLKRAYSVALQGEQPPFVLILPDGMIIVNCHSSL